MRKLTLALLIGTAFQVSAQVPVVDAGNANSRANAQGVGNELVVSLYNQLEALQSEVQTLRGLVEEQSYQLQRLQTESKDRYLDVDRRLSEVTMGMSGNAPVGGAINPGLNNPAVGAEPVAASAGGTPGASQSAPVVVPAVDEQELYRTALNLLLEESKYAESVTQFKLYISTFPKGRFLTNALYWQGEALILESKFPEAIEVFNQLLTSFPQDAKAAGAMLKTGVANNQMGNRQAAEDIWRELPVRYPENTPEIKAAQDYLRR